MPYEDDFGILGATLAGAFHVERVVAHGGFAIVYRGIHAGFRAPIALKCLRIPEGMSVQQRATFLERFREEGELLFRLSAAIPEIVRPLHIDAVQLNSGVLMPFLALEWLDGEGFDQVLSRLRRERNPGMDLLTLVDTLRPVAHALSRAHRFPTEAGTLCVVHRDLKPENLFLCSVAGVPTIKILDYGIAEVCSVARQVSGVSAWGGMNPFTPGYGAPEQWAPDRYGKSGPWTDVWGLALTMTEALAGKPAIDGDVDAMRRAALDPRRRPTPRSLGNVVSNDVEKVFQRALALDPRDRTPDLETFWNDLESAAGVVPTISQRGGAPSPRSSQRRSQVTELSDDPQEPSIDLDIDLDRAPESMRLATRTPLPSVPPRAGMLSIPPILSPAEACEEELPLWDDPPVSQRGPVSQPPPSSGSGPRSGPRSIRPDRAPASVPPASTRVSTMRSEVVRQFPTGGREPLASEPDAPAQKLLAALKGRFRIPSILLFVAIGITLVDLVVVRAYGAPISLGPVRSFWLAGPLALIGAAMLVWKIVAEDDDG